MKLSFMMQEEKIRRYLVLNGLGEKDKNCYLQAGEEGNPVER